MSALGQKQTFREYPLQALRDFTEGTEVKSPPLKGLMEGLIDGEIGNYSVFVSRGYLKRTWTPIVTVHLDRMTGSDGSPIGQFLSKQHGKVIAAMLGKALNAEWIYTSWVYPVTSNGDVS